MERLGKGLLVTNAFLPFNAGRLFGSQVQVMTWKVSLNEKTLQFIQGRDGSLQS